MFKNYFLPIILLKYVDFLKESGLKFRFCLKSYSTFKKILFFSCLFSFKVNFNKKWKRKSFFSRKPCFLQNAFLFLFKISLFLSKFTCFCRKVNLFLQNQGILCKIAINSCCYFGKITFTTNDLKYFTALSPLS